ncbi:peptidoglycan-recognition protein LC-like [Macrosteles quadrilineatus]|uniref:peptidoglycan-recognition protein LC-like n=1 Tax=Macrosteles quadrilineatus TaxID=74068 RepID=UPI0023E13F44|nr:peptidoglycan-recognition protein LC-like [Macrosteles quadrilineatus]
MDTYSHSSLSTFFKVTPEQIKEALAYEDRKRKRETEPQIERQYLPGEAEPLEGKYTISYHDKPPVPNLNAIPITIVSREEWGSQPRPKDEELFLGKVPFVHQEYNSGTPQCYNFQECSRLVREIQQRDLDLGYSDIRYNFLVGDDWNVYEGRGWYVTPEKTNELPRYHGKYYEIAFIGDMRSPNHPTFLQSKMLWSIFKKGMEMTKTIDKMKFTLMVKHLDFYPNCKQAA